MANYGVETAVNREKKNNPQSIIAPVGNASSVLPPPDGGFHAWAQVVSGHFVVALTWGYAASFGVFQNHYESTLPQTPSDISWIGGVQVFCLLFISTLSGRATDAGMARLVVGVGAALLLLGTFMTSLATEYWQIFLAQGVCTGIGQGLMWLPSVTLISTYFVRLRVFAVTAAATGTSTGGMIFPAMIQHLTPKIGFPWAVRCMGFVVLFMVIVTLALLRPRLPPRKSGPLVEWGAFKEPAYMLFTLGVFLLYWTLYFAFFYIQVYATEELGLSQEAGVNLIIVTNALGIPIRAPFGYLADRYIGPLNCLIPYSSRHGAINHKRRTIDWPIRGGSANSTHRGRLPGFADVGRGILDRSSFGPCGSAIHNIGTTSPSKALSIKKTLYTMQP